MHYSNDAFYKDGHHTITALDNPDKVFGQRHVFRVGDIKQINLLYKCPEYIERFANMPLNTALKD